MGQQFHRCFAQIMSVTSEPCDCSWCKDEVSMPMLLELFISAVVGRHVTVIKLLTVKLAAAVAQPTYVLPFTDGEIETMAQS